MEGQQRHAEPHKRSRLLRAGTPAATRDSFETQRSRSKSSFRSVVDARIPRGIGAVATLAAMLFAGIYGAAQGGHLDGALTQFRDARDAAANMAGFRIAQIALSGNKEITREEILATAGVTGTTSLLFLDADTVRERLKENPWIADATILKLYPDRLSIAITERRAFALWQKNGFVSVIAADGTVVQPFVDARYAHLPLVVGEGAQTQARDFLGIADGFPLITDQVYAYILVAQRRWNLRLKNGIDIRLPELHVAQAFDRLIDLDRDKNLLTRDLLAIDLRLTDRVTVRLSDDAAAARAEMLKDKKKRKGGNA